MSCRLLCRSIEKERPKRLLVQEQSVNLMLINYQHQHQQQRQLLSFSNRQADRQAKKGRRCDVQEEIGKLLLLLHFASDASKADDDEDEAVKSSQVEWKALLE